MIEQILIIYDAPLLALEEGLQELGFQTLRSSSVQHLPPVQVQLILIAVEDHQTLEKKLNVLAQHYPNCAVIGIENARTIQESASSLGLDASISLEHLNPMELLKTCYQAANHRLLQTQIHYFFKHQGLFHPRTQRPLYALWLAQLQTALRFTHPGKSTAVLLIRLFKKPIFQDDALQNDLLYQICQRIALQLSPFDTLGHLDKHTLALFLVQVKKPILALQHALLLKRLLKSPFQCGKDTIILNPSISLALAPEDGCDATVLIDKADKAIIQDAEDEVAIVNAHIHEHLKEQQEQERLMRQAFAMGQFVIHPLLEGTLGQSPTYFSQLHYPGAQENDISNQVHRFGLGSRLLPWQLAQWERAFNEQFVPQNSRLILPIPMDLLHDTKNINILNAFKERLDEKQIIISLLENALVEHHYALSHTLHELIEKGYRLALHQYQQQIPLNLYSTLPDIDYHLFDAELWESLLGKPQVLSSCFALSRSLAAIPLCLSSSRSANEKLQNAFPEMGLLAPMGASPFTEKVNF